MNRKTAFPFLLFLITAVAVAAAQNKIFQTPPPANLNAGVTIADEAFSPQKGMGYMEVWAFWAKSVDGAVLFAQYLVSNTGFENEFPGYNVTVVGPDGEYLTVFKESRAKELSAGTNTFAVSFPGAQIKGRHPNYRVRLDDPDLKYDLKYHVEAPGMKQLPYYFGEDKKDFFTVSVIAPDAKVTGTMTIKGKTFNFNGWGYGDHSYQNVLSTGFAKRWYSIRFRNKDIFINHAGFLPQSKLGSNYVGQTMVIRDGKVRYYSNNAEVISANPVVDPKSKFAVPSSATLLLKDPGCKLEMEMDFTKYFDRVEILARLNPVTKKIIGTFFANPYIYRINNKGSVTLDLGQGPEKHNGDLMAQMVFVK